MGHLIAFDKQAEMFPSEEFFWSAVSRRKIPTRREHHLSGSPLATVSEIKDLGITVTNTLHWSQHIKLISSKANRTLGFIRRVCRDINDPDTKKLLYCSVVRPQLEYACELWSPYLSRKRSAQGHKVYFELSKGCVLQGSAS